LPANGLIILSFQGVSANNLVHPKTCP
jgi:hypothetical protein